MSLLDEVTATTTTTTTATGPTVRTTARSARLPALLVGLLLLTAVVVVAFTQTGPKGYLDPAGYDPDGSRAVVEVLRDRGVVVTTVDDVDAAVAGATPTTTTVLVLPDLLPAEQVLALRRAPGPLVVVDAGDEVLLALEADAEVAGGPAVEVRTPSCEDADAVAAGPVRLGGFSYAPTGTQTVGCYASGGAATLLRLPEQELVLVGSGELLTNQRIDEDGNAALALRLLGGTGELRWLRPGLAGAEQPEQGLDDLLPTWLKRGVLQLFVVLVLVALWRARRLGRVVVEPLPSVVRAAEVVEGRSRLYRLAGARGRAADALRSGTRHRLVVRLGLPPDADRPSLVQAVAARTGDDPAGVDALLYGAAPADDAALVRFAEALSQLEKTVIVEVAGP